MAEEIDAKTGLKPARRLDLWVLAGGVFFVGALLAAAYPAVRAGPATGGGLMLLAGLAGVAVLGLFAFRHNGAPEPASDLGPLLGALAEPAAVVSADGRILAANPAWRAAAGPLTRLPRPRGASTLFSAL
ncbi:MAG: cckA, partial [Caulobacteraceae bacterium]|nr:cckA [Caulobacteraceae bacterium]